MLNTAGQHTSKMKIRMLLAFTGYHESDVRTALDTIIKRAKEFDIMITNGPTKHRRLLEFQARLWGNNEKDISIYSLAIWGTLENGRDLITVETPEVLIELATKSA